MTLLAEVAGGLWTNSLCLLSEDSKIPNTMRIGRGKLITLLPEWIADIRTHEKVF